MFVKLIQVAERSFLDRAKSMSSDEFTTVQTYRDGYFLQPVILNVDNIVYFKRDSAIKAAMDEGKLPSDLLDSQEFTKIYISCSNNSNSSIVVVGDISSVAEKIMAVNSR